MPSADIDRRNLVGVHAESVTNVSSTDFPGHWPGEDHSWSLQRFKDAFRVEFYKDDPLVCQFDLIHIDASIANAFRRIMLAEIPTLAIETVYVANNTGIIQDEVLAHRLGLIPLTGDRAAIRAMKWFKSLSSRSEARTETFWELLGELPGKFARVQSLDASYTAERDGTAAALLVSFYELYTWRPLQKGTNPDGSAIDATIDDTIALSLHVACERKPNAPKSSTDPDELYTKHSVYARDIIFKPTGLQSARFSRDPIRAVNPDILIAKLRPGQEIEIEMHCHKGFGKDHAKFSPVCTASYRLLPYIRLKEPIRGMAAVQLQKCFPKGVIEIVNGEARVKDARNDTVSREVLRYPEFRDKVELGRIRDHFIFSVESTGQFAASDIFLDAVGALQAKCLRLKRHTENMLRQQAREEAAESTNGDGMEM